MKVYTVDIFYGDKLIDTIEVEAGSMYSALINAKEDAKDCIKVEPHNVTDKEVE